MGIHNALYREEFLFQGDTDVDRCGGAWLATSFFHVGGSQDRWGQGPGGAVARRETHGGRRKLRWGDGTIKGRGAAQPGGPHGGRAAGIGVGFQRTERFGRHVVVRLLHSHQHMPPSLEW